MSIEKPISELLTAIEKGEYLLPEFQRGYVWNADQVKVFIRSLYLGYPTGYFLIWKTENPSQIRGKNKDNNLRFNNLILDGQQRLTTIYTIFCGKTPEWYEGASLRTDLYFNLEREEFQYYQKIEMNGKPEWIAVSDFLVKGGLASFMSELKTLSEDVKNYYMEPHIIDKLAKLEKIKNYGYYIKEVDTEEVEKVVDIFNLVNKQGTKLTESDLALAIITSRWDGTKERFRKKIDEYDKKYNYKLNFIFFIRLLNMITTGRGIYTSKISKKTETDFDPAWDKLNRSLLYLINILREDAFIDSEDNFSSIYVLSTLVYFLTINKHKFSSEEEKNKAIYWTFMAQLWGWYSGGGSASLEKDMNVLKNGEGIDGLINNLSLSRGKNLYLTSDDIAYQSVRSKVFPIFYATIRARDACDWTDVNIPLYSRNINNALQRHHIFPKNFLREKYNAGNSLHSRLINEIANMALIKQESDIKVLDRDPEVYLPEINEEQRRKQFVPLETEYYTLDNFEEFLDKRRELIAEGINQFLRSFFEYKTENRIPSDLQHLNEAIENIEIEIRHKISEVLDNAAEENGYDEFIPSHIKQKVKDKLDAYFAKNPGESLTDFESTRSRMEFFDLNECKEAVTNRNNWDLFQGLFGKPGILEQKFNQLGELRNCIRHSRPFNEVVQKEGEAAIAWFNAILFIKSGA